MMTQEEIDAILNVDSRGSSVEIEVVSLPEESDTPMDGDVFDLVKDFDSAVRYLNYKKLCSDLLQEYAIAPPNSYSSKVAAYRIIVAALTSNEKCSLTKGKEKYFPVVQFCKPGKESNCIGKKVVGRIQSEGEEYVVMSGGTYRGSNAGLGDFHSSLGVSFSWATVGFRSVSSRRVAEHISEHFGCLLFEVCYGGTNCNWRWKS